MRELKPIAGARALLFDRLVDLHPDADEKDQPFRILNREQLKASVRREIERLLNTRCSIPLHLLSETERSVVNYGIPDFSSLSTQNDDDRALVASIIGGTITAFEPRLRQVHVEVEQIVNSEDTLRIWIEAMMVVDLFNEPVSFPVFLNSKNGAAEVHDSQ